MMQTVETCPDAPDTIAHAKFMPDTGHAMRAFGEAILPHVKILTVVRFTDGWWRVWGLSDDYRPSAAEVMGTSAH